MGCVPGKVAATAATWGAPNHCPRLERRQQQHACAAGAATRLNRSRNGPFRAAIQQRQRAVAMAFMCGLPVALACLLLISC